MSDRPDQDALSEAQRIEAKMVELDEWRHRSRANTDALKTAELEMIAVEGRITLCKHERAEIGKQMSSVNAELIALQSLLKTYPRGGRMG